jgi:predicted NAD/FAD-dependent oxidoreductase
MRVGVVGAGVAGLAAARSLAQGGVETVVFESEAHVGGRCRTVSLGPYTFDPGATSIVPRGLQVEHTIVQELDATGLVKISLPVYTHDGRRIFAGAGVPASGRYCYVQGIQHFAELVAQGTEVRLGTTVSSIEHSGNAFAVANERFDALVIAVPTPTAENLLATAGDERRAFNTRYRSCLSVLLGFDRDFHAPYHAVVAEESAHPLHWLSIENLKVPGRAPEGHTAFVVQMGPKYSKWNFEAPEPDIVADALVDVERVIGRGFDSPKVQAIVRWSHSQPDSVSGFETLNPPGTSLVIAGDGLEGGRIEHAYASGLKAAKLLLGK